MGIKIKRVRDGEVFEYKTDHALALLRRNSKDWAIADDNYELKDNEIIRKPNKGNTRKSNTEESDT